MRQLLVLFCLLSFVAASAQNPKIIGDCSITYDINVENGKSDNAFNNASKIVYTKGKQVRTDITSPSYNQTTIYNYNTGDAVILKEVGPNKYMSSLKENSWQNQYKRYENSNVNFVDEEKIILGYRCKKAMIKLNDGSELVAYYTTAIAPSVQENPYQFKGIPGFVLEYQSQMENAKSIITFTATKFDLSPVPISKFDIPKAGYRVL